MPVFQHLCAVDLINAIESEGGKGVDILEDKRARYHNYQEGFVADSGNNVLMFVVNAGTRDKPEWLEARFTGSSSSLGMSYRLVPLDQSRRVETPIRGLNGVKTYEAED